MASLELREAVAVKGVTKRFGATVALEGTSLAVSTGEVHALLGENGAGKSTLVKLLSGLMQPDEGKIRVLGKEVAIGSPRAAHALGIQTAFQELTLIPDLSVTQNLLLPYEPASCGGLVRRRKAARQVQEILSRFGLEQLDPDLDVRDLDLPVRQKIEIVKAVSRKPKILLLDEPTSTLSSDDVKWLGDVIAQLRSDGVTVVFISHRMPEVRMFCDTLSVLRNGKHVGTFRSRDISDDEVIRLVIGRELAQTFPDRADRRIRREATPALAARHLATGGKLREASLDLWSGEILGVAALQGMGQLELFLALFGMAPLTRGTIAIDGAPVTLASPRDALRENIGISLMPEDRKTEALLLKLPGRDNVSLPVLDRFSRFGWIDTDREIRAVDQVLARVNVHPRALYSACSSFSGGNQQKIALAKWLLAGTRVLLMYDPTRGVDIGTKHEIYVFMSDFVARGGAILFYSTEIAELVHMCDRVIVMYRGGVAKTLSGTEIGEEAIIRAALGHVEPQAPALARSVVG